MINEASLISFIDSDELIRCVDLFESQSSTYLILEFMDRGSLTNVIRSCFRRYSEDFCKYIVYKAVLGLKQMHEKNVLHRDIKSDNILFSNTGEIKICDLGYSCILS